MLKSQAFDDTGLASRAGQLAQRLIAAGSTVATAESCTGGWIAKLLTDIAGSSAWFLAGAVSYSNDAKSVLLGVDPALIAAQGAVSEPVARAMAAGIRERSGAALAVAVTGIAGPSGGSREKPVGLVWLAFSHASGVIDAERHLFDGDRDQVRRQAVAAALDGLLLRSREPRLA